MAINSATITENVDVVVTQPLVTWTVLIARKPITENAGVMVTQNGQTGSLLYALDNVWTINIDPRYYTE